LAKVTHRKAKGKQSACYTIYCNCGCRDKLELYYDQGLLWEIGGICVDPKQLKQLVDKLCE
jgi:hypothetical protein